MTMSALFAELADIFAADVAFEQHARAALEGSCTPADVWADKLGFSNNRASCIPA